MKKELNLILLDFLRMFRKRLRPSEAGQITKEEIAKLVPRGFTVENKLGAGGMGTVWRVREIFTRQTLALKHIFVADEQKRCLCLQELYVWLMLPKHSNLTAYRFLNSVGPHVCIFTEFINGGSLDQWIKQGKVSELDCILDVAIQSAWGLHVIHGLGLVHLDVKPANILMQVEDDARRFTLKYSDFGLTHLTYGSPLADQASVAAPDKGDVSASNPPDYTSQNRSEMTNPGFMSPPYCSPEQACGNPLSRYTDVWSWAVSVLDVVVGRSPCCTEGGERAAAVLERYIHNGELKATLPEPLADILRACFRENPSERPSDLGEITDRLKQLYQQVSNNPYSRVLDPLPAHRSDFQEIADQFDLPKDFYLDGRRFLKMFRALDFSDYSEKELQFPVNNDSWGARWLAELAIYDEACRIAEKLRVGYPGIDELLSLAYVEKAVTHSFLSDVAGTRVAFSRAIELMDALVQQDGTQRLVYKLAVLYRFAWGRMELFSEPAMQRIYGHLLPQYQCVPAGDVLYGEWLDRLLVLLGRLVKDQGEKVSSEVTNLYLSAIRVLVVDQRDQECQQHCKIILMLLESQVIGSGRSELAHHLARAYLYSAIANYDVISPEANLHLAVGAVRILVPLVLQQDRGELAADLAVGYLYMANALQAMDKSEAARNFSERGKTMLRALAEHGRTDLADLLFAAEVSGDRETKRVVWVWPPDAWSA